MGGRERDDGSGAVIARYSDLAEIDTSDPRRAAWRRIGRGAHPIPISAACPPPVWSLARRAPPPRPCGGYGTRAARQAGAVPPGATRSARGGSKAASDSPPAPV